MNVTAYPSTGAAYRWLPQAPVFSKQDEIHALDYIRRNSGPRDIVRQCHYNPANSDTIDVRIGFLANALRRAQTQFWRTLAVNKIVTVRVCWIAQEHRARKLANAPGAWRNLIQAALKRFPH